MTTMATATILADNPFNISAPQSIKAQVSALLNHLSDSVLAIIIGIDGASYRPLGATMVFFADGLQLGSLSSGCIEADLAHHAQTALEDGKPLTVRYGLGSPFIDIKLPCGGGVEILLVPRPDKKTLTMLNDCLNERQLSSLCVNVKTGKLQMVENAKTQKVADNFYIQFTPEIQFLIFGKGHEASTFAGLVSISNYPNILSSPDDVTLAKAATAGGLTQHLTSSNSAKLTNVDPWTAIILFFHDHEWEIDIISRALKTNAFYIGAQGSQTVRDKRHKQLAQLGASTADLQRLKGPIGLIKSARDARTLAVSVLAEILELAK